MTASNKTAMRSYLMLVQPWLKVVCLSRNLLPVQQLHIQGISKPERCPLHYSFWWILFHSFCFFSFPDFTCHILGLNFPQNASFLSCPLNLVEGCFLGEKKTVLCKSLTQFLFHLFTLNLETHFFDWAHTETGSELHFLL